MKLAFRPLTLAEVIDRSIRMYRASFTTWLGIAAVVLVPQAIFSAIVGPTSQDLNARNPEFERALVRFATTIPPLILTWAIAQAALAWAVAEGALGRPASVAAAYRRALRRLPALLVVFVLTVLVGTMGLLALIVPGVLLWLGLALAPTAVVIEGLGPLAAMRRSWRLTRGDTGRLFLYGGVMTMMGVVLSLTLSTLAGLVVKGEVASDLAENLASILMLPAQEAGYVLLYFDNRVRKEGFDLALMAQQLGAEAPPPA